MLSASCTIMWIMWLHSLRSCVAHGLESFLKLRIILGQGCLEAKPRQASIDK
jgi:hypothetical protein